MSDSPGGEVGRGDLDVALERLEMTPAERRDEGISQDDIAAALQTVLRHGGPEEKVLEGVTLPAIRLDYEVLGGENTHPLDLTGASIEALDLSRGTVRTPIILEEATIGELTIDYARFERDLSLEGATVESLSAYETTFDGNVDATGATVSGRVTASEAAFEDDVSFEAVTFQGTADFDGATFYGESNRLEDNTSFARATFAAEASFRQATFGFCTFEQATFAADAAFTEAVFDGDDDFSGVTVRGEAAFAETDHREDASFAGADFESDVTFRGARFEGGARSTQADATFAGATFAAETTFREATFRGGNFDTGRFEGDVTFEAARFRGDATFESVVFGGFADFDEVRFGADAGFTDATFQADCDFRGAEFHGGDNHLEIAAEFRSVTFEGDADFTNALFGTAAFESVVFAGVADFRGATFQDEFTFVVEPQTAESYVDLTRATLKEGTIRQTEGGWVRYDLTEASLGDVVLEAATTSDRRELLDYFRFCETEFNEFDGYTFDFSDHVDYLDRNDWVLHEFEAPESVEVAVPMDAETIERTYLKAKLAASSVGNQRAAGEFRVKRQQYGRYKHWEIARDQAASVGVRARNAFRALENLFLGVSCGHGLRLTRIIVAFAVFPLFPAALYSLGGPFATGAGSLATVPSLLAPAGLAMVFQNVYFSYITFLTIGYGNIAPVGWAARLLAAGEVYVSVILGGLVIYALVKRSEV